MKKVNGGKLALILVVLLVVGGAAFGYFKQSKDLTSASDAHAGDASTPGKIDPALLVVKPADIIIGDVNALVTIVEYSSLSCSHCAHFHEKTLPDLQKEFITPGKVKLVMRHFPLNEPAIRGAQLVECAGNNGLSRANFLKVLFEMQAQWAFSEAFMADLKRIALVGGLDSAAFESCMADKDLETRILLTRQEAGDGLGIDGTPSFFIDGVKMQAGPSIEEFRKAIKVAEDAR